MLKQKPANSCGVIIGRFQVPALTEAHKALLDYVQTQHTQVLILLGVRPAEATETNPLSYAARVELLRDYPVGKMACIVPISDMPNDKDWSEQVDRTIRLVVGMAPVMLYGGRDSFVQHYSGKFPWTVPLSLSKYPDVSGTMAREDVQELRTSENFRRGVIYALREAPEKIHLAVDMAVFSPRDELLVIRKHGERGVRLPGGMVDLSDDNFSAAATRETQEESGIIVERDTWVPVGDFRITDWRVRDSKKHGYHTILYTTKLPWHHVPTAGDDAKEAMFVAYDYAHAHIVPEHVVLLDALDKHFSKSTEHAKSH